MPENKKKLPQKVVDYLMKAGVPHNIIEHKTVYTAYDAAMTMGKKLEEIAKSLVVKADKDYYMVLLPANKNLDLDKVKKNIGKLRQKDVKVIKIPGEKIMKEALKLKDDTVSAFGQLHKLPVIMDKALSKAKKAIFSSGGVNHSIEMKIKDFLNLEKASEGSFSVVKKIKKTKKPVKKVVKKKKSVKK
ncbi:MAG: YbaK/EbsC family protein [Patescibacteria group bacterium]|jgi:prolyl-tRNA editing enzyme YbaK/EbsC (Cys-tRNA(Pro) deacylase)